MRPEVPRTLAGLLSYRAQHSPDVRALVLPDETVTFAELNARADFYADAPFVVVVDGTPRIKDVVGSNYAHIGVATDDGTVAVFVVIDNLVKGAAGGAIQWMNRQLGLEETTGLTGPALAWT